MTIVPSLIRSLNNLAAILEKGAAYAEVKNIDQMVLLDESIPLRLKCDNLILRSI